MKTPKAKKLPSGKWHVRLQIAGKMVYITEPTKKAAEAKAALLKIEAKNGVALPPERVALGDAIDRYIADRQNTLSPETMRGYRVIRRNRFKSVINRPIGEIRNWQRLVDQEAGTVSAKTVRNAWGLVRSVLAENGVRTPEVTLPQVILEERPFLQPDSLLPFVDAVRGNRFELAFLCGLHSLRRSEILALTRDSFVLTPDGWEIQVRGAVVYDGKKLVYKETNKNSASRRNVPVFIDRLPELIDSYDFGQLTTYLPEVMTKELHKVCREHSFPEIGMHGLRHSFASLCYFLGIPEAECMKWGGWSDPEIMRKIYTHIAEKMHQDCRGKLRAFFRGWQVYTTEHPETLQAPPTAAAGMAG